MIVFPRSEYTGQLIRKYHQPSVSHMDYIYVLVILFLHTCTHSGFKLVTVWWSKLICFGIKYLSPSAQWHTCM